MSRFDASRLAAVDSSSIVDTLPGVGAHPVDADTLRTIAGQANAMNREPGVIYSVMAPLSVDGDTGVRDLSAAIGETPRLLQFIRGPRRPHWRQATAYFEAIINLGAVMRVGYVTGRGPITWSAWTTGTGARQTIETTVPLPFGFEEQDFAVWVEAQVGTTLADAVTIGGASSVSITPGSDPIVRVDRSGADIGGIDYTRDEVGSGLYAVAWVDPGGDTRWTKRIDDATSASYLDQTNGRGTRLSFDAPRLGKSTVKQTHLEGGTFEIRLYSAWFDLVSHFITGAP